MTRRHLLSPIAAFAMAAAGLSVALAPTATAAPSVSGVAMSTDGFSVDLSNSVSLWNGSGYITRIGTSGTDTASTRYGTFGNGSLNVYFGSKGTANAYFLARGGYVKKTGGTCDAAGTFYQRARITLSGLPSGAKDVWAFWDGSASNDTSQWENAQFAQTTATGTSGASTVTVASATGIEAGQYAYGTGIGSGATVTGISGTTITLSVNNSGAVSGTVNFGKRDATTTNLDKLCSGGSDYFVEDVSGNGGTAGLAVLPLGTGGGVVFNDAAGLRIDGTTSTSVSFDVYVPTSGGAGSGWKSLSLGMLVDVNGDGTLAASDDYGIQTQIYARPWTEGGGGGSVVAASLLEPCSSPSASSAPCLDNATPGDNGVFAADGTTRIGGTSDYSIRLKSTSMPAFGGQPAMLDLQFQAGLSGSAGAAAGRGFEVPAGSIVKFKVSLPTSNTSDGSAYGTSNFLQAGGNTTMKVDPANPAHSWNMATSGGRTTFTFRGEAASTSRAVSKMTWQDSCDVQISGSTVTATGCSADSDSIVIDTVPTTAGLTYQDYATMKTIGGGFVSTNAQGMAFGEETMLGQSFQFAVAGPSAKEDGSSRSTDGFYYVCVPEAFLSGSFGTTPAAAASTWQGTRDGAVLASGVSFAAGTCGVGAGLVASYPTFGYSAPLFSVKPPAAPSSGSSGSSGSTTTTTTTTTTTSTTTTTTTPTAVPVTPVAAPVVYPTLAPGKSVAPAYLLKLAEWTPSKNATVSYSVPRMYRDACTVNAEGRVVATGEGLCGVRIKVVSPKGKIFYKRVYLTAG